MKIQINSLEALERLIGGDNALEFDIRQSVVEAFCKKHLKAVVTNDLIKKLETTLITTLQDDLLESVGTGYAKSFKLTPKAKEFLDKELGYSIDSTLIKMVKTKVNESDILSRLDRLIENQFTWIEQKLGHEVLEKRLNKMVDERIKSKLGL